MPKVSISHFKKNLTIWIISSYANFVGNLLHCTRKELIGTNTIRWHDLGIKNQEKRRIISMLLKFMKKYLFPREKIFHFFLDSPVQLEAPDRFSFLHRDQLYTVHDISMCAHSVVMIVIKKITQYIFYLSILSLTVLSMSKLMSHTFSRCLLTFSMQTQSICWKYKHTLSFRELNIYAASDLVKTRTRMLALS